MTIVDQLIADLGVIKDRADLIAFIAPLRVPDCATDTERAALTSALIRAASRCWANQN
jgi:hypothetical protein